MIRLEELSGRAVPATVFAAAGPVVYEYSEAGDLLREIVAFDDAPAVPVNVAATNGFIVVGAGAGGGPRLVAINTANMVELWSRFVGDPAGRTGVSVAAVNTAAVRATPSAAFPPDPRAVATAQSALDRLYPEAAASIAGWAVEVFAAPYVTDLPQLAHLRGVPTPGVHDDRPGPARTYDRVRSAADLANRAVYVNALRPSDALHEAGHAVAHEYYGPGLSPDAHEAAAGEVELWGRIR